MQLSSNGAASPSEERTLSKLAIDDEAPRKSAVQNMRSPDAPDKELCLEGFLIQEALKQMRYPGLNEFYMLVKVQEVGQVNLDNKTECHELVPVHLFSLGRSESGAKGSDYQGLLLAPNEGAFKRMGLSKIRSGNTYIRARDTAEMATGFGDSVPRI